MRAQEQSARRRTSIASGAIDHLFHYQGVKQSQLWLEVHRKHAPLAADRSFEAIFRRISNETAAGLKNRPVHVIGLGPGGGEKEAWLLEALRDAGCPLRYTPVDASLDLALLSAETAAPFVATETLPVVGDLSLIETLPSWLDRYPQGEHRLYTAFGLTPNFLPSWLFSRLGRLLQTRDQLLLSANLAPLVADEASDESTYKAACETILPQYDNPETLCWLGQVLLDWGLESQLSKPRFHLRRFENVMGFCLESEWLSEAHFEWENAPFHAREGERLRLFFSLRYTPERLAEALQQAGLNLGAGFLTPCGQEGVWQVAKHVGGS